MNASPARSAAEPSLPDSAASSAAATAAAVPRTSRVLGVDAYRGFVMLLMMAELLQLRRLAEAYPGSGWWNFLAYHQSHVDWVGCSLHDLIQPSFSFLVGVSLPYSIANRLRLGQSYLRLTLHAAWRSVVLIFLGIFLRSLGRDQTNFTFEDTLTQIGLGYLFLFFFGLTSRRTQWIGVACLLLGYWLAFALYPLPSDNFDWSQAGVAADWEHHLTGFAAHWNKNTNLAWAFDRWFMNLFPRSSEFQYNGGGYSTLSFIPTLGTMLLGLIAGGWLKDLPGGAADRLRYLITFGVLGLAAGWMLDVTGICPVVKKIWTPSWTLYSGGWAFLLLALFYYVIDVMQWQAWSLPLRVIGMNSIAAYCMDWLFAGFFRQALRTHLGADFFDFAGQAEGQVLSGAAVLLILWLILWWMYRRRIFLKI